MLKEQKKTEKIGVSFAICKELRILNLVSGIIGNGLHLFPKKLNLLNMVGFHIAVGVDHMSNMDSLPFLSLIVLLLDSF